MSAGASSVRAACQADRPGLPRSPSFFLQLREHTVLPAASQNWKPEGRFRESRTSDHGVCSGAPRGPRPAGALSGKLRAQNRAPASRGRVRRGGTGLWWVRAEGRGSASQSPLRVGTLALHPALCQRCCLSGVRPPTPESRRKLPGASHLVLLSVCPHSCTRPGLCPGPALPGHRVAVASHCSLGLRLPANEHCTGGP